MDATTIIELLVASIAGSGGLVALVSRIARWWGTRRHTSGLRRIQKIHQNLNVLMTGVGANRVALIDSCNGGATPAAGKPLNVQTVAEVNAIPTPGNRPMWATKRLADADLVNRLVELLDGEPHSYLTKDLPDGMLKTMAEAMDSDKVILQRVAIDEKCMKILALFMPTESAVTASGEQLLEDVAALLGVTL